MAVGCGRAQQQTTVVVIDYWSGGEEGEISNLIIWYCIYFHSQ